MTVLRENMLRENMLREKALRESVFRESMLLEKVREARSLGGSRGQSSASGHRARG